MTQDVKEIASSADEFSDNDDAASAPLRRELEKRDAIISAINFLSTQSVCNSLSDGKITLLLQRLGEALDVSRVYVFRNGKNTAGAITMTQTHEWTRPGVDAQIDNPDLQEISYLETGARRWMEEMQQGREIAGLVRDFPASEQEALSSQGIVSLLAVPIYVGDTWWGFIGFDHCIDEHRWDIPEIQLLRSAANTIGAAMLYQRIEDALRTSEESERRYRLVAENVRDVILVFDRQFSYTYISPSAFSLTGYTAEEVMALPIEHMLAPDSYQMFLRIFKEKLASDTDSAHSDDTPCVFELEVLHRQGHSVWTETSLASLWDASGNVAGLLGVCRDISQRRHAQVKLEETIGKLRQSLEGTINAIARTVEIRDPYTAGHQKRVAELAAAIARRMGLGADTVEGIRMAGVIHDIGKIAVPAEILSKPGRITPIELGLIKNHPAVGYQILKDVNFSWPVADITLQHHERLDGSGYPNGIAGDDILLEARIIAVADVVEAMASHRPYRPALGIGKALEEIQAHAGHLYDADAVRACVELFNDTAFVFSD